MVHGSVGYPSEPWLFLRKIVFDTMYYLIN